jgi:hypothetical protein
MTGLVWAAFASRARRASPIDGPGQQGRGSSWGPKVRTYLLVPNRTIISAVRLYRHPTARLHHTGALETVRLSTGYRETEAGPTGLGMSSRRGSRPQVSPTAPAETTVPSARITAYLHWGGSM